MNTAAVSSKVAATTVLAALATITAAVTKGTANPATVGAAALTVAQFVVGYLTPHKPIRPPRKHPKPKPRPKPAPEFVRVFDSANISGIGRLSSTSSDVIAAYDDGAFNNVAQARRDYPSHRTLTIAIRPQDTADFYDFEPGCIWPPAEAPAIIRRRRAEGAKFIGLYGDLSTWVAILQACRAAGEHLDGVCRWLADQNGVPHIPAGFDGCQYDGSALDPRLTYDVSLFRATALSDA